MRSNNPTMHKKAKKAKKATKTKDKTKGDKKKAKKTTNMVDNYTKLGDRLQNINSKMKSAKYGKWDSLKSVPKSFTNDVALAETIFRKLGDSFNHSFFDEWKLMYGHTDYRGRVWSDVVNKLYPNLAVCIPPETRFVLTKKEVCLESGHKKKLKCVPPNKHEIQKIITNAKKKKGMKRIYIPITYSKSKKSSICANGLLISPQERPLPTMSVHDPKGLKLSKFNQDILSKLAEGAGYTYKTSLDSSGFLNGSLGRYAVLLPTPNINLTIKSFMNFVVKTLQFRFESFGNDDWE